MILSDERFYCEVLDTDIPALAKAAGLYKIGDTEAAAHTFAEFIKKNIDTDLYFKTPYYPRENIWAYPDESDREVADRVCEGKLMSCGIMHDFGGTSKVDWESNPTYNSYVEWPYQLNRHHEFRCLGRVYRDTCDEKYAKAYADLIRSWIENCECPRDLPGNQTKSWRTLEAGLRMISNWQYAIHAFLHSPSVDDRLWVLIFKSLWEHAYRITTKATHNNWLITEMTGLIHIANIYKFFRESESWREYGYRRMTEENLNQVYDDGFQFELTSDYHWVCLMTYQFVVDNSILYGVRVPDEFMAGIRRMYSIYPKLVRPDGRIPALNDGSNAIVKPLLEKGLEYFPDDAELIAFKDGIGRENFIGKTTVLPYSGMVVMRTGFDKDDIWAFFESAPYGKAHQHEDKLSFLLSAYGKNMLTDSGIFAYDSSNMRKYILSSRAHNTGLVDGMGQNRLKNYAWDRTDIKKLSDLKVEERDNVTVAVGTYNDGYGEELLNATHQRRVYFYRGGVGGSLPFFVLYDKFSCDDGAEHHYEASFQLGTEPLTLTENGGVVNHGDGVSLGIFSTGKIFTATAQSEPYMGWRPNHAAGDVKHYPAPVLSFYENGKDAAIVTVLYPTDGKLPSVIPVITENGFTVTVNGHTVEEKNIN